MVLKNSNDPKGFKLKSKSQVPPTPLPLPGGSFPFLATFSLNVQPPSLELSSLFFSPRAGDRCAVRWGW